MILHLPSSVFHLPSFFAAGQLPAEGGLNHYLLLSALLFAIGFFGVLLRRNTLIVYMCLELMLSASTLAAVAFSRYNGTMDGNIFVFFIITVAAAEVAVGLAIIVALFRLRHTVQFEELTALKH
jgi:NADH-quinone oxidoreductase subunit K